MNTKFTSKFLILMALFVLMFSTVFAGSDIDETEIANKLNSLAGTSNVGREYIFSIPPPYDAESGGFDNFIRVFVISPVVTNVKVGIGGSYKTFKSQGNGLSVVDIPAASAAPFPFVATATQPAARIYKDKAIHILAEEPVVVYVIVRYKYTTDGFLGIPISSLGKEYTVATSQQWGSGFNYKLTPWINVTAAFDKTKMTFTMGGGPVQSFTRIDGGGALATGQSRSFNMNKGDVMVFCADGEGQDVTGSRISSNRPISIVSGHACNNIPTQNRWCDYTCEMELPTVTWGRNVIVPKVAGRVHPGIVKLFAKEEETDIYRDGNFFTTVSKTVGGMGESYIDTRIWEYDKAPKAAVLTSVKPFYAMFFNPGTEEDNGSSRSDPFTMVMTPVEQFQNDIIFCTPNAAGGDPFNQNWLNVIVNADSNGYIPDDFEFGTFTSEWQWQKVKTMAGAIDELPKFRMDNNPNNPLVHYLQKNITLPFAGVFRLRCASRKFASYSYGYGSYESYGYPTSAALADLATLDIWNPIPTFTMECDGENGMTVKSGLVKDPIYNDDQNTQSKLSDVYMKRNESYNYDFNLSSILEPGEEEEIGWTLKKINPREDSRAVLVFIDKAGNDTTIVIEDLATKLDLAKDENYGNFKLNDPAVSRSFTVTNNSKKVVLIDELKLWKGTEGFKIEPLGWDKTIPLAIGESKPIIITFTPDNNLPTGKKLFIDSLGVGDSCLFANLVEIRASLGAPLINADNAIFGAFNIDSPTPEYKSVRVENPSPEADLTIIGASSISDPSFTATFNFPTIKKTQDITPTNPLTIKAGKYIEFDVYFKPTSTGTFTDKIVFTADASLPDNVTDLYGIGIQAQLAVNGMDWGEYRINRPGFPIAPKIGIDASNTPVLTLVNNGTQEVVINDVKLVVKSGDPASFLLDDKVTPLTNFKTKYPSIRIPAGQKFVAQLYFSPTKTGRHEVELTFENNANIQNVISTLIGTGIVPRLLLTPALDFGPTIVNDVTNPRSASLVIQNPKKLSTDWEFGDTLTLGTFDPTPAIANNLNTFGTEGFRYENSGFDSKGTLIPNLNGYRVAPGEAIYVNAEFVAQKAGPAAATLVLNSDAEVSADPTVFNNTSIWTGTGLVQGVTLSKQDAFICTGTIAKLNFSITNTGTTNITISNLTSNYTTDLVFDDPTVNASFTILAGASRSFTMTFSPTAALARRTVTLSYNTDILGDTGPRTETFEIEAYDYTRTSRSKVYRINPDRAFGVELIADKDRVSIGEQFGYKIFLDPGANFDNANLGNFEVSFTYPKEFIQPIYSKNPADMNNANVNSLQLGSALTGKYEIDYTSIRETSVGNGVKITFTMKALGASILSGDGELISLRFKTYLPTYTDSTKDVKLPDQYTALIEHTLSDLGNPCFEFVTPGLSSTVILNDICAAPIRAIVVGTYQYELKQINPNPVGSNGANIDFSVGIEGPTELVIYNSNKEVVATVASGLYKEGTYSVPLPIEKLASGTYFYELKSGFYSDMKPLVIVK